MTDRNDLFRRACPVIIRLEVGPHEKTGGLTNDPDDPGGLTKWGISKRAHPDLDIANLTRQHAEIVYFTKYWGPSGAPALPWPLALVHFDAAVNHGRGRAKKFLEFTREWRVYLKLREAFYRDIAKRRPEAMKYIVSKKGGRGGWLRRLDHLETIARETQDLQ